MNVKTIIICIIIGLLLGCGITAGAGYYFWVRPDRSTIAGLRAEVDEYRSRAERSEARLTEGIRIIKTGEGRLTTTITSVQQAISTIREIRKILQDLKNSLNG